MASYFSLLRSRRNVLVTAYRSKSVSASAVREPDLEENGNLKGEDFPVFELEAVWGPLLSSMIISSDRLRFRSEEEPAAKFNQYSKNTMYKLLSAGG